MQTFLVVTTLILFILVILLAFKLRKNFNSYNEELSNLKTYLKWKENQDNFRKKQLDFLYKYAFSYFFVIDQNKSIVSFSENVLGIFPKLKSSNNVSILQVFGSSTLDRLIDDAFKSSSPIQGTFEIGGMQKSLYSVMISEPISQDSKPLLLLLVRDDTKERQLEDLTKNISTNISHELKTPLTVIKGYNETALAQLEKIEGSEKIRYFINKALNEASRLNGLISKLLEISRIESGMVKPKKEKVDLFKLVNKILGLLEPLIQSKSIEIRLVGEENKVITTADEQMIGQAIYNIIENAVKFSKEQTRITIEVRLEENDRIVTVMDEGPGIPRKDLPFIFQRFYMANESRKPGLGSGLGLASAKHLLLLNGGSIDVFSEVGRGSTFRIIMHG